MKTRYVEIDRGRMETFLQGMGFTEMFVEPSRYERELIYVRCHDKDPKLVIKVYTSIASSSSVARERGADAIRVVLVGSSPGVLSAGIWKGTKILRTGTVAGVFERIRERAREAYAVANRVRLAPHCKECGFYTYLDTRRCANGECITRKQPSRFRQ